MELNSLTFHVDVLNILKLLVLAERDKRLNCDCNFIYLLYCHIVVCTTVDAIVNVNGVFMSDLNNSKKLC